MKRPTRNRLTFAPVRQSLHTPPPTKPSTTYMEDDETSLALELDAMVRRWVGEPQESFWAAIQGQVLFG